MYCCVVLRQRDKKLCGFSDLNEYFYWTLTIYTHKYNYSTLDVSSPMLQHSRTAILGEVSSTLLGAQLSLIPCRIRTHSCQSRIRTFAGLQVQVQVTLRLTVSQSVSLGAEPRLGPMTRCLLLLHVTGLFFVGHPL
jgi:hypothetical protein